MFTVTDFAPNNNKLRDHEITEERVVEGLRRQIDDLKNDHMVKEDEI
jgi:hypothetical protein